MGATAAFQLATATAASTVRFALRYAPALALHSCLYAESPSDSTNLPPPSNNTRRRDVVSGYLSLIRPVTLVQAIGAFVVGCLSIHIKPNLESILSVYLSYGAGMVANDVADTALDVLHSDKKNRAIASGRISKRQGYIFSLVLSLASCVLVASNRHFLLWTASNLLLMLLYAIGLQKVLIVKNVIVGYLGISPLIGAVLQDTASLSSVAISRLCRLASVGMAVGVAREILKDIEDTRVDKAGGKATISNVYGPKLAHRIAFGIVWATCAIMISPPFRSMFYEPFFITSWLVGTALISRATFLPVKQGQRMLKKSIYVLLGGMTGGFMAAR